MTAIAALGAVLDGLPQMPQDAIRRPARPCPECGAPFEPVDGAQLFCGLAHRRAWNNRATVRGAKLAPLAIVARLTRNGSRGDRATGRRASADANALIQAWRDADRAAGRMDQVTYLARRYAAGYDPL